MDRKSAVFMSMGFEIVGIVIFAIYFGRWLDTRYDLNGMGVAGTMLLGFVGWFAHVIVVARMLQAKDDTKPK
jgi:hypothetical protein